MSTGTVPGAWSQLFMVGLNLDKLIKTEPSAIYSAPGTRYDSGRYQVPPVRATRYHSVPTGISYVRIELTTSIPYWLPYCTYTVLRSCLMDTGDDDSSTGISFLQPRDTKQAHGSDRVKKSTCIGRSKTLEGMSIIVCTCTMLRYFKLLKVIFKQMTTEILSLSSVHYSLENNISKSGMYFKRVKIQF